MEKLIYIWQVELSPDDLFFEPFAFEIDPDTGPCSCDLEETINNLEQKGIFKVRKPFSISTASNYRKRQRQDDECDGCRQEGIVFLTRDGINEAENVKSQAPKDYWGEILHLEKKYSSLSANHLLAYIFNELMESSSDILTDPTEQIMRRHEKPS